MRRTLAIGLVILFGAAMVACGSDKKSGSASQPEVCDRYDDFKSSLGNVTSLGTLRGGASSIRDALTDVSDDLDALRDSAGDDFKPEIDALQTALRSARTSIEALGGDGSLVSRLAEVTRTLSDVNDKADDLRDAVAEKCQRETSLGAGATGKAAEPL